jgi:uncharacterized protein
MSENLQIHPVRPWYREPWPWYLMSGPFIVVVAALTTAWIAYSTSDGLVTDDYYKQGLVVDRTLARSKEAVDLGLEVRARFTAEGLDIGLISAADGNFVPPKALNVTLSHPTRAGLDQSVLLAAVNGRYVGKMRLPASGHWLVLVEDDAKTWRLMGNVLLPALGETVIGGPEAADLRSH